MAGTGRGDADQYQARAPRSGDTGRPAGCGPLDEGIQLGLAVQFAERDASIVSTPPQGKAGEAACRAVPVGLYLRSHICQRSRRTKRHQLRGTCWPQLGYRYLPSIPRSDIGDPRPCRGRDQPPHSP
jgi:hypothetical protein